MRIYKIVVGWLNKLADRVIGDTAGTLGHVAGFMAGRLVAGLMAGFKVSCPSAAQKDAAFWAGVKEDQAAKSAARASDRPK